MLIFKFGYVHPLTEAVDRAPDHSPGLWRVAPTLSGVDTFSLLTHLAAALGGILIGLTLAQ